MTQKISIADDETITRKIILRKSDQVAFEIQVSGVTTGITSPTSKWFKRYSDTDLSSTYLSGSASVSGVDVIITKSTTGLNAGEWILSVGGTVDGIPQIVATIPVDVKRDSDL